jgi:AAA15 family ATPase/GTPase
MLLEFSVENFRSIGYRQKVSFVANNAIHDMPKESEPEYGITRVSNVLKTLNVMAFYGHNSSGKSNLFMAMNRMIKMVVDSVRLNEGEALPYEPFAFSNEWSKKPTSLGLVFMQENSTYEYCFSYNENSIVSEKLSIKVPGRSRKDCFIREGLELIVDNAYSSEFLIDKEKLNPNRLLISLVGQLGGQTANDVLGWFIRDFDALSGSMDESYGSYTKHALIDGGVMSEKIKDFIRYFDLGFTDISAKKIDVDKIQFPSGLPVEIVNQLKSKPIIELMSTHICFDEQGNKGSKVVSLDDFESEGTIKLVHMSGVLVRALHLGSTIAIDEFDARIHPKVCKKIVELFNSPETNPKGAQLFITTHDTNLMTNTNFRRDQISFVKQDERAYTVIYPLLDVVLPNGHTPRSDSNYERNYLLGLYDQIPSSRRNA